MNYTVEVCVGSVVSAVEAEKGGAGRVELCDNLFEGGTTPSPATIEIACRSVKIPVYVMIRPRGGDFLYSDLEFEIMKRDTEYAGRLGAAGIVSGILTPEGKVDEERTGILVEKALSLGMAAAFHRAFDMVADADVGLEAIIRTGCRRILTSGGKNKAIDGKDRIARMVRLSAGRISVMAGSGVTHCNAKYLATSTGVTEIHLSGRRRMQGGMIFRNTEILMGGLPGVPEFEIDITDAETIRRVVNALKF